MGTPNAVANRPSYRREEASVMFGPVKRLPQVIADPLKKRHVSLRECGGCVRINVQHGHDVSVAVLHWNHDFAVGG